MPWKVQRSSKDGGLYCPPGVPRGSARNGTDSVEFCAVRTEWGDPKEPVFWCIVASPFRADPHGMVRIPSHFTRNPRIYSDYSVLNLIHAD
jgi:hypothetical protein